MFFPFCKQDIYMLLFSCVLLRVRLGTRATSGVEPTFEHRKGILLLISNRVAKLSANFNDTNFYRSNV